MRNLKVGANSAWPVIYLALLGTLGLQSMRVLLPTFVYYLRDARGVDSLSLAPIALGTFALGILAWPLHRALGVRRGLLLAAGGLGLFRLLEQASFDPSVDLYLSGAALVFFMVSLPLAYGWLRNTRSAGGSEFGMGVLVAHILDTAIHTASWSLDLSWRRGWVPISAVALLAAGLLLSAWRMLNEQEGPSQVTEGSWGAVLPLAALGPYTFFHLLVYQNIARTAAYTGWSFPIAGAWTALANLVALTAVAWVSSRGGLAFGLRLAAAIGLLVTTLAPGGAGLLPVVLAAAGVVVSAVLLQTVLMRSPGNSATPGLGRTSVAFFAGFQVLAIASFLYYVTLDLDLGFRSPAVLPAAAGLLALAGLSGPRTPGRARRARLARELMAIAVLAVLVPLGLWVSWRPPEAFEAPANPTDELRVMTYNIHQGFDTAGRLDIEALARVIEEQNAHVVALQEVSRGYLINGSLDMVTWLSRRLNMAAEFGPTADPQWGNALLTRLPLDQVMNVPLPPDSLRLRRAFLDARFQHGGSQVRLMATHLHHVGADSEIRQVQAQALLEVWDGSPNTILLGDLNAEPDSPEMQLLAEAGWLDAVILSGSEAYLTFPSDGPDTRLDYILVSQGLAPAETRVITTQASDHLPILAALVVARP